VIYPTTCDLHASREAKLHDLHAAFADPQIKGIVTTIGGDEQVGYMKYLNSDIFLENKKPFFGYSDSTHFINYLWLLGIPAFYGGCLFTEFAMHGHMDELTVKYLKHAMFVGGEIELEASPEFNDIGLDWSMPDLLGQRRKYEPSWGWSFDGAASAEGRAWGGNLESIDDMLRCGTPLPSLGEFESIILYLETSEEIPSADYVFHFMRGLGERGILERIQGLLVGRPKAWEHGHESNRLERQKYRETQIETILAVGREYNKTVPIVQNMDFGHTAPQIPIPSGKEIRIDGVGRRVFANY
jgi:muramoyltetrapeptide carboxypeptidase LdcA involved in peptidoglycan recycling